MTFAVVFVAAWLIFAGFGGWIAGQKHRPGGEGFALGLLFGPLGCLVEAVLPTLEARAAGDGGMVERFKARLDEGGGASPIPSPTSMEETARRRAMDRAQAFERRHVERQEELRLQDERREWVNRMVWRFGWFKALPEAAQPILIGLALAAPVVAAIVFLASR